MKCDHPNLTSPSHQASSTPCALASVPGGSSLRVSPRPEYPNSLLPKALSGLPANSSFTIPWAAVQGQCLITPYLSIIYVSLPDPSEISQPGPKASSTRKLSETTQLPQTPPGLSAPWSTSAKLPRLPTPIPFCIQLPPQTPLMGVWGGREQTGILRPLLAGSPAPALTDPSLALAIAPAPQPQAARWSGAGCTVWRLGAHSEAPPARGAQGTGDISSQPPRERLRGSRAPSGGTRRASRVCGTSESAPLSWKGLRATALAGAAGGPRRCSCPPR